LQADYVTVVEDKRIMSAKYRLPKLTHPAVWSLCNSWATCYYLVTGWAELR